MTTPLVRFDKYEVVRRLGRGGMGTVYLARDPALDRLVAIKVLRDALLDDELLERFMREARAAAHLRHENLITIYEVGQQDNQPFMAMEYVDGESLDKVIVAKQPLPVAQRLHYIEQICAGLYHAHCAGIVHRDVKPANLMIDRHGVVRILDFGIARVEGSAMTGDGAMIGTLPYMSPEQMLGKPVEYRSDIFAVGAVAYELLSYQRAFNRTFEDASSLLQHDPAPLEQVCPKIPPGLPPIVMRALATRPEDRFENVAQMEAAIRQVRRTLDPTLDLEPDVTRVIVRPSAGTTGRTTPATPRSEMVDAGEIPGGKGAEWFKRPAVVVPALLAVGAAVVTIVLWTQSSDEPAQSVEPPVSTSAEANATTRSTASTPPIASTPASTPSSPTNLDEAVGQEQLSRITASYKKGDLDSALVLMKPLAASNDARVVELANAVAQSARRSMVAAATAATSRKAQQLAPDTFALAEQSKELADAALRRKDFMEAGTQALLAAAIYTRAEREASAPRAIVPLSPSPTGAPVSPTATAAVNTAPNPTPVAAAAAAPPAAGAAAPPPAAPPPIAATPPSTAGITAPAAPAPNALDRERAGILQALTKYQAAYRERSIQSLVAIYPSIPRETRQRLERTFTRDCRDYDVTFGNMLPALNDDPTYATVTVRTTYTCQPKGAQAAQQASVQELFVLRKLGDAWLIESAGTMDAPRPR